MPDAASSMPAEDWITQNLPPDYQPPALSRRQLEQLGKPPKSRRPWVIALSILLVIVVISGATLALLHQLQVSSSQHNPACAGNTPCGVANAYLADYTGGKYEALYALTSQASRQRFSDNVILNGNYKDAHDYIVSRTAALINEAQIYSISATAGKASQKRGQSNPNTASVPVRVVMQSASVGVITQDITLPLVREGSHWRITWSPGLVFSQLDDVNDPSYHRLLHLFPANGTRGTIYDRDGNTLAKDEEVYVIGVVPGQLKNSFATLKALAVSLDFTPAQIQSLYQGAPSDQFVAIRTITPQLYTKISGSLNGLQGVMVQQTMGRVYPYGTDTAAVTGYVGQVSADDIKNDQTHYYASGDVIGRAGVELWGEQYLRPTKGGKLQIVARNADGSYGQVVYTIASRDSVNGADIHTTISLASQQAAMAQMRQYSNEGGSGAVAVDPATGAVLVLASNPIYDPNDFSLGFTPNESARFNALDHPYLNRALSSAFPIGSAFKIVTLAAGLENGVTPSQTFVCDGHYQVPGEAKPRNDDQPKGHGTLTAAQAIPPSCDVVFWKISVQLNSKDPNILPNMTKSFGYGSPTGMIGVPDGVESAGLVPTPQYLQQHENAQWSPTDAANLAIGQGFFQATPVQVAMVAAAIADNGVRMQPRLVSSVVGSDGAAMKTYPVQQVGKLPINSDHIAIIQTAMLGVTSDLNGTASPEFRTFPIRVAGKTGTAESGQHNPNSWFECYAPASPLSGPSVTPQIAIGAVVPYSGFGEQFAVPISKRIMQAFFKI